MAPKFSQLWTIAPLRSAVLLLEAASALARQAMRRGRHRPVSRHERRAILMMAAMLKWLGLRMAGRLAKGRRK